MVDTILCGEATEFIMSKHQGSPERVLQKKLYTIFIYSLSLSLSLSLSSIHILAITYVASILHCTGIHHYNTLRNNYNIHTYAQFK